MSQTMEKVENLMEVEVRGGTEFTLLWPFIRTIATKPISCLCRVVLSHMAINDEVCVVFEFDKKLM
jgi:hypothetical protein